MDDQGLADAAMLMLAIGEEAATQVFRELNAKEAHRLGEAMLAIDSSANSQLEEVLGKFQQAASQHNPIVADSNSYVKNVVTRALGPERADLLLDRIIAKDGPSGIERLNWMDANSIYELIGEEHPQIIASVLLHLEADHAAEVMKLLEENLRAETLLRMATMGSIHQDVLVDLDAVLTQLMRTPRKRRQGNLGGAKVAAQVLNHLGSENEKLILNSIRDVDEELAEQISDQMFTFGDLLKLDDKAIQLVLREIQSDSLIVALKAADAELRERIFKNMSQRAAETLREDLESRGPVRMSEVEEQQKEIMKAVRRLADEGQIQLSSSGGGDGFV
jgi:flagellar motor switch protein FliG